MADVELRAALTAAWVAKLEEEGRIHRCGDCRKWMTRSCPSERLGNDGRSRGPSSETISCPEFGTKGGASVMEGENSSDDGRGDAANSGTRGMLARIPSSGNTPPVQG